MVTTKPKVAPLSEETDDHVNTPEAISPESVLRQQQALVQRRPTDTLGPKQAAVQAEKPAKNRDAREEQLRLYNPLALNKLFNETFERNDAKSHTQKRKINALLDQQFGKVQPRRSSIRMPEDRDEGEAAV